MTDYQKCPVCGFATIYKKSREQEFLDLMERTVANLKHWKTRFAMTEHAKLDQKEATLLIEAINIFLLTR